MEANNSEVVVEVKEGKELPLPPENPIGAGIVVPVTPEDKH